MKRIVKEFRGVDGIVENYDLINIYNNFKGQKCFIG